MLDVTVLIPTYNHGHVLPYQIESLLNQTRPPQRIVVLDDASTDGTLEILQKYKGSERIRVIAAERNIGVHAGMNLLLKEVETEFFAFAAADDLLTNNWCMTAASLLERYPDAKMAISNSFICSTSKVAVTDSIVPIDGAQEGLYRAGEYLESLMSSGRFAPSNTILYRADIIEEVIRPVVANREMTCLVDVLLILAIAAKYPVAYSTMPTGVFFRSEEGYGSSAFKGKEHVQELVAKMKTLPLEDDRVLGERVRKFLTSYAEYSWSKQTITAQIARSRTKDGPLARLYQTLAGNLKLFALFIAYRRFLYMKKPKFLSNTRTDYRLEDFVDKNVGNRLNSAV
jgi:glycosyltransferase involved in cell wall biosynthesis